MHKWTATPKIKCTHKQRSDMMKMFTWSKKRQEENVVSNLVFYAQSTTTVISGREETVHMDRETARSKYTHRNSKK